MLWAAFWLSCAQLEKFRLNPNRVIPFGSSSKFPIVETSNGMRINRSDDTSERFLGSQLALDTRAKVTSENKPGSSWTKSRTTSQEHWAADRRQRRVTPIY